MLPQKPRQSKPRLPTLKDILRDPPPPAAPFPNKGGDWSVGSIFGGGGAPSTPAEAPAPPLYWMFQTCAAIGAVLWLQTIGEFIVQAKALDRTNPMLTLYLLLLGTYMGSKEVGRPSEPNPLPDHRTIKGEFFVKLWVATAAVMFLLSRYEPLHHTKLPVDLFTLLTGVLGIYGTGRIAKKYLPKGVGTRLAGALGRSNEMEDADIFQTLASGPANGMTSGEVAKEIGVSPATARNRLAALAKAGKVVKVSSGPGDPHTRYKLP